MSANQQLHVVFGTGPLGLSVMQALVEQGKRVRMVNRSGKAHVPAGVEVAAADAYDHQQARKVTEGAYAIYQCAQPRYTEWVEKFPPLQASVLEAAAANGAKFIVGENLYMYGEVDGLIHEKLPYTAHTRKGGVRARMADAIHEAHAKGKIRAAQARASDFYGPGATGSVVGERVFYPLLEGKTAQMFGNLDLPHSITYIGDFGRALAILGDRDEALGEVWHVPNAPVTSSRAFLESAFRLAGKPPKIGSMSKLVLRIGGLFIPEAYELIELAYEFQKPFVVDSSKFERTFGISATPFEDGLRATLDWYRANPKTKH
jgi:nucleoside-diphosphate-sugar epimerase